MLDCCIPLSVCDCLIVAGVPLGDRILASVPIMSYVRIWMVTKKSRFVMYSTSLAGTFIAERLVKDLGIALVVIQRLLAGRQV